MQTGPHDALTDIRGLRVGHAEVASGLSGTTVVLAPEGGMVAGVDVRGAVPGTRELDLLRPEKLVQRVHAIVLSGGSVFGLAAAAGVMAALEEAGAGFPTPGGLVPIVPAATVHDLGRGGPGGARPGRETGVAAFASASDGPVAVGRVGVGRATVAGSLWSGVGTASAVLDDGTTVAALAVLNGPASPVHARTGTLHGARWGRPGDSSAAVATAAGPAATGPTTTLAVVATDAALDKAGCARLATMGHDGLTRAVAPGPAAVGEIVFGLSTATRPTPDFAQLIALHAAAARVVTRAAVRGLRAAGAGSG